MKLTVAIHHSQTILSLVKNLKKQSEILSWVIYLFMDVLLVLHFILARSISNLRRLGLEFLCRQIIFNSDLDWIGTKLYNI